MSIIWETRLLDDNRQLREINQYFKQLRSQANCNLQYFQPEKNKLYFKFYHSFKKLQEVIDYKLFDVVEYLFKIVHHYDLDPSTPANGYRSFLSVVIKCSLHLLQLTRYIVINRGSFIFRGSHYSRELDDYVVSFCQLCKCLLLLKKISTINKEKGALFPSIAQFEDVNDSCHKLLKDVEKIDTVPFYGRCLGFQYSAAIVPAISAICWMMVSYSDAYRQKSLARKVTSSILGGGKYLINPELRAKRLVEISKYPDIGFCTEFWSVNEHEYLTKFHQYVTAKMSVDQLITIPAVPLYIKTATGSHLQSIKVMPPCSSSGPCTVTVRLISHALRKGQEQWLLKKADSHHPAHHHHAHYHHTDAPIQALHRDQPPQALSSALVFHCHGGGFVAQSSASHVVYLRQWATLLNAPILSVDYSLAPEHQFPRAIEDVFFAYCWALKNPHLLGWTGEKICFVGDSAGGNIATSTILRCIMTGIRKPDHLVGIYTAMRIQYIPSASRLLSVCDPMLPLGILEKCLAAYSGISKNQDSGDSKDSENNPDKEAIFSLDQDLNNTNTDESAPIDTPNAPAADVAPVTSRHGSAESTDSGFESTELNASNIQANSAAQEFVDSENKINSSTNTTVVVSTDETNGNSHNETSIINCENMIITPSMKCPTKEVEYSDLPIETATELHYSHSLPIINTSTLTSNNSCFFDNNETQQNSDIPYKTGDMVNDMFMSPILAPDHILKQMCPCTMVTCHLDSFLDDSLEFVRRLRGLNRYRRPHHSDQTTHTDQTTQVEPGVHYSDHLVIVDGDLPHGFLNFSLMNTEAHKASERVAEILKVALFPHLYERDNVTDDDRGWNILR